MKGKGLARLTLLYGLVAGLLVISVNVTNLQLGLGQAWLGFLVMFIALGSIYFAVRGYRDNTLAGSISFLRAFGMGLGISLVASLVYVLVWELYLAATDHAFINDYADSIIAARKAAGATEAEMAATLTETAQLKANYANPAFRLPMSFVEIFPVGLVISLISALVLRKR